MAGVYWVGADGNIWYKNGGQAQNAGKALGVSPAGFDAERLSAEAAQINDPNPPQPGAANGPPANPNNTAATQAAAKPDKSNDIRIQQAGLAAADTGLGEGIKSIDKALTNLTGTYDSEATSNEKNYTEQSTNNQQNFQKNKQTALVNASQGRQGLYGTLASLGALNGDGLTLANRAVQKGANDDLSGAADNYSTNATQLDTAIGTFRDADKRRREEATSAADNAKTNARADTAKTKQSYLSNLSNDYSAMGDEGNARTFAEQAASLYPEIARNNLPNSNISYSGAAFTPGSLASYMAGADSTVVRATPTDGTAATPGLVASPQKKKELQTA